MVMRPIIILAVLLLVTCLQSNIANAMLIDYSEQIAENLTEVTPEMQELLNAQDALAQGINAFIESLEAVMHQVTLNSDKLHQVTNNVSERVTNVNLNSCRSAVCRDRAFCGIEKTKGLWYNTFK